MKLIVGLGNPTAQYENTRHNTGFIILNEIQKQLEFPTFEINKKFEAEISEKNIVGEKTILVKPQSFMNLSGEVTEKIAAFYKIPPANILIIHDDLDLELGKFKVSNDSSAAGHNGVQNIFDKFGTQAITRIRIGIEGAEKKLQRQMSGSDFVLQKFSAEELETIKKLTEEIVKNI
ncbi:MAG: aminoacyl-tRNA hydrolase [Candidatus Moranbacteria bacterium]|nr:aminoacyl-tRNA hydrolase [Candidatus Moranbacteria bacterium]